MSLTQAWLGRALANPRGQHIARNCHGVFAVGSVNEFASPDRVQFVGSPQAAHPVTAGTPTHKLQRLGGWKTQSMVERYAHITPDHLQVAESRLDILFVKRVRVQANSVSAI